MDDAVAIAADAADAGRIGGDGDDRSVRDPWNADIGGGAMAVLRMRAAGMRPEARSDQRPTACPHRDIG
jgi:hypothetical protein